jgi:hypothetical protein
VSNFVSTIVGDFGDPVRVGAGNFPGNRYVNGWAGTGGTDMAPGSMSITINLDGGYFNGGVTAGLGTNIGGGTDEARAFILLHELAHNMRVSGAAAGFIQGDTTPSDQVNNNNLILKNCGSAVDYFAGRRGIQR